MEKRKYLQNIDEKKNSLSKWNPEQNSPTHLNI